MLSLFQPYFRDVYRNRNGVYILLLYVVVNRGEKTIKYGWRIRKYMLRIANINLSDCDNLYNPYNCETAVGLSFMFIGDREDLSCYALS